MTTTQNILLIILATSYAVMLVLSIIAISLVIKILKSIRHIASEVERGAENFSETVDAIGDKIKPIITAGILKFVMKQFKSKRKGSKDE